MALDYNLLKLSPPEPTVKIMTAQEFLSGSQAVRDARRKRAIEESVRSGVDAEGNLSTDAIRQSLIAQGFGEDADRVVREISMARLKDISDTFDVGTKLKAGVESGLINPDIAQRALGTSQSVRQVPVQSQVDNSWMEGVPGAPISQEILPGSTGEDGSVRITGSAETMQPLYEYERTESKAQAVPEYSANLIDFAKKENEQAIGDINISGSSLTYTLPEGADKDYILAAAKTLGYTASDSAKLDEQLTSRAIAQVPRPVLVPKGYDSKSLLEARAEYAQKMAEYPALVAQKKAELIKELEAGQATRFGQGTTREQEARAKEAQQYALAGQRDADIFARPVSPTEAQVVKLQRSAISDITMADISSFEGQYQAALAKAKADGSVNQDAILSNLVAMGAIPSEAALALKQYMTPGGSFTSEGFTFAKRIISALGKPSEEQRKAQDKWKTTAVDNINQYIIDNGGFPVGSEPKSASTAPSARDALRAKGVGAKKADVKPGSNPKSGSERSSKKGR